MTSEDEFVEANGLQLCYRAHGDSGGEPLLLIMGLGWPLTLWPDEFCQALVDSGHYVVRFDNRDTGRSTWCGDFPPPQSDGQAAPYLLTDMAADAVGLLDALDIDSAHLVGASMGGMIAQTIAIEHPSRARTLTSIMSSTGEPDVGAPSPTVIPLLLESPPITREAAIESGVAMRKLVGSPGHFDEAVARQVVGDTYDRGWNPEGRARQLMAVMASGSREVALAQLKVPTLVVHGDADPLVSPSGGHRTAELIPGAELIVIEGMGHDLPPSAVPRIADAISSMTSGLSALG